MRIFDGSEFPCQIIAPGQRGVLTLTDGSEIVVTPDGTVISDAFVEYILERTLGPGDLPAPVEYVGPQMYLVDDGVVVGSYAREQVERETAHQAAMANCIWRGKIWVTPDGDISRRFINPGDNPPYGSVFMRDDPYTIEIYGEDGKMLGQTFISDAAAQRMGEFLLKKL